MIRIQQFEYSVDLLKFIFWQYDQPSEENVAKLIKQKQASIDMIHAEFWEDWYSNVFNIGTANEFGIAVWSIILGLPGITDSEAREPNVSWGFGEFRKNYNNGNFSPSEGTQLLTIEQKRAILKMRYASLVARPTVPEINKIMNDAFGDVVVSYCIDNHDMTLSYVFETTPEEWMVYAIETLQVLPRPSTIGFSVVDISNWILVDGAWEDTGNWVDSEPWNDGP